jgi:hypothetical protein
MAAAVSSLCRTFPQSFIHWLVGCEDHRPLPQVPIVHDTEEHVGRPARRPISDLIDDEELRVRVGGQRFLEISALAGFRKVLQYEVELVDSLEEWECTLRAQQPQTGGSAAK